MSLENFWDDPQLDYARAQAAAAAKEEIAAVRAALAAFQKLAQADKDLQETQRYEVEEARKVAQKLIRMEFLQEAQGDLALAQKTAERLRLAAAQAQTALSMKQDDVSKADAAILTSKRTILRACADEVLMPKAAIDDSLRAAAVANLVNIIADTTEDRGVRMNACGALERIVLALPQTKTAQMKDTMFAISARGRKPEASAEDKAMAKTVHSLIGFLAPKEALRRFSPAFTPVSHNH